MKLKQNYNDYDKVKDAFKEFVSVLVWESVDDKRLDIDSDVGDTEIAVAEINGAVDNFAIAFHKHYIEEVNNKFLQFENMCKPRYEVFLTKFDENGVVVSTEKRGIKNAVNAIDIAVYFREHNKFTEVSVYDIRENECIMNKSTRPLKKILG